jgi:hypothetical protein
MEEQPSYGTPVQPASRPKWRKLAIITGVILGVLAVVIVIILSQSKDQPDTKKTTPTPKGSSEFKMTTDGTPVSYAGAPVYDACGIIPFDTVRKNVKNYQTILDINGTDKKPGKPLVIEHNYIDRTIPALLGKDGEPRPTATSVGGSAKISASSFISNSDTNCWYGQGSDLSLGLGNIFAKVFVTQKPTPLSGDLTAYLAGLTKTASQAGIDIYVEPQTDDGGFFTSIIAKPAEGVMVFVKGSTREFTQAATLAAANTVSEAPKAPMNLTYPSFWSAMPNPCSLLTADDFTTITTKPASALAEDTMILNEVGGRVMQRSCDRLEVERLDGTPISKTYVTLRMGKDIEAAKAYVKTIKDNKTYKIQQLKQRINIADDAYIKTVLKDGQAVGYEFDMRIGQTVIVLAVDAEDKVDASADAFSARMLPLAKSVAERFSKQ